MKKPTSEDMQETKSSLESICLDYKCKTLKGATHLIHEEDEDVMKSTV